MKKITLVLFTLLTLLPLSAWGTIQTHVIDGVTYNYDDADANHSAIVASVSTTASTATIHSKFTIAATNYTVTSINDNAFSGCSVLTTLVLTGTDINIISNIDLTTLPKTLIIKFGGVGYYHQGTWASGYYTVGDGNSQSGYSALPTGYTTPTDITILNAINGVAVTKILSNAFNGAHNIQYLTIPNSITEIANNAFASNRIINFYGINNANYHAYDGVLFNSNQTSLLAYPAGNEATSYTIPSSVNAIGAFAFGKSSNLTTVTLPTGLTSIGNDAFSNLVNLTEIIIPSTVTTIGSSAFANAGTSAETFEVTFSSGSQLTTIESAAFQQSGLTSIQLPEGMTTIASQAFNQCTKLSSITIPASLTTLGGRAFGGCSILNNVTFLTPTNLTTISANAFNGCSVLSSVIIPEGITTLASGAFKPSGLESIYLPTTTTTIANDALPGEIIIYRTLNLDFAVNDLWSTYYSSENLTIPSGLTAHTITDVSGTTITTKPLNFIPAGKAVLLQRASTDTNAPFYGSNQTGSLTQPEGTTFYEGFIGSTTATNLNTIGGDKYVLSGDNFVKVHQGSLPAFRCYLSVPNGTTTASNLYINDASNNTFIIQEEGTLVNKNSVSAIGYASLVKDGELMKLTVTPGTSENYYAYKSDITVRKNVTAVSGRAPSLDDTTYDLKIVGEDDDPDIDPDPSGTIEYTFGPADATAFEVTINFHKRNFFNDNSKYKKVTLAYTSTTYDGTAQKPDVTEVKFGTDEEHAVVVDPKNYSVSYEDNTAAGTGHVIITGQREFRYTNTVPFSIAKRDINNITVNEKLLESCAEDQRLTKTFTGSAIELTAEELGISDLKPGSETEQAITENDYQVTYENNTNVSTTTQKARINIVSKTEDGVNYQSTKVLYFTIAPKMMTDENVADIPDQTWTGEAIEPALTITYLDNTFTKGTDYDVVYTDKVNSGIATATITFKGNYSGEVIKYYNILNHEQSISVTFDNPDNQWTTYYNKEENLALPESGLEAYVVTGLNGLEVQTTPVNFIPKETAVLLHSTGGEHGFNLMTQYDATLDSDIENRIDKNLFRGTTADLDISSVEGTKFVLLNGKFIQAAEGTVAPNRCYLVVTDPIDVAQLTIKNGTVSNFIYQQDGTENNGIGTAEASTPKDGKVTLTVKPNLGYYINGKADITVVKNANAGSARAQQIDGGNVDVTEGKITDNADYTSTYEFTYPYETNCQYQITVNFHQATNIQSTKPTITFTNPIYNGLEQKVKPTVAYGEIILKEGEDYVLVYPGDDYTKAGTDKKVTVWGIRKYSKDLSNNSYSIEKRPISGIKPVAKDGQEWKDGNGLDTDNPQVYFSGSAMELNFTDIVKYKDEQNQDKELDLLANDNLSNEITVTYSNNTFVGNATATIKTKNVNYGGTDRQINFEILQKELKIQDVVIEDIEAQKYTGSEIKPALTIKYGEISLIEGEDKDYTVAYSNNINAGEATATITFHGNYTGSIEKKFTIEDVEETITINFDSDNEWTTYYGSKNLSLTETEDGQLLEAFVVTGIEEAELNTTSVTFIPQNTPVLLHRISGTKRDFDVKTCSTESLDASIVPSDIFKGSLDPTDIATVDTDKIKFILLNGQFVQTTSETLGAGRCYIALDTPPAGVNTLTIGKSTDGIIILEEEAEPQSPSVIGTVNKATNGNITTLTVKANRGWYVETNDITVVRSTNASNGRAPLVDGNNVEITAGDITTENEKYSTTYLFTYPYSSDYSYQVKVNFHKSTELLKATTTITLDPDSYEYDKTVKQPQVTSVTVGDVTLTKDVDYVVTYPTEGNINAGKGKVLINGIRKYNKELSPEFDITKRSIANHVTLKAKEGQTWVEGHELGTDDAQVIFTGKDIEVDVVDIVKDAENNETNIITADDYNITYNNNHKDASTTKVSITVSNKGSNYQGSKPFSFTILPKEMTGEDVKFKDDIEEFEFTGAAIEPEFTISYNGISLVNGTDYDVTFKNNVYAGEATATITFKGNYSGVVTKSFGIKDHLQPITVEFDNPDNQWNTYYYKENLTLPTDGSLKAYVVTGREGLEVNTKEVTFIPRNTAVLLFSESEAKKFELTTSYNSKLDEATESSIDNELFIGTETGTDISTVTGTKFVLLNDKFIQTAEGTVAPNRCYLVVTEPIEGVTELTINKAGNAIIYQEDGKATTANLGTASTSEPKDGKVTLTVQPKYGYYVEQKDITVVKNTNAGSARAPRIDEGKVTVDSVTTTFNENYAATYEFTYPYEEGCQYQITVDFHKAANLSETGRYATNFAPAIYNGFEQKVEPTVTYDGATLKKDVDYVLTYSGDDYINAGTKTAEIIGIRKFQNSLTREFKIEPKNVNDITVEAMEGQTWIKDHELGKTDAQVVYTGSEIKLNITDKIKDAEGHDVELLAAEQVDITYSKDITNVGKASVIIKGNNKPNYTGQRTVDYTIVAKEMTSEDIAAIDDQEYTGNEIKPALTIKYGDITLVEGEDKDYIVAYSNNVVAGEATATVTFKGNYSGTATKTFKIVESNETITINFDSDNEWTTYYATKNLKRADDIKVYVVTKIEGLEVMAAEVSFIPKETPVLLHRESGEKTSFEVQTCSNETLTGITLSDTFKGTLTDLNIASVSGTKFVLRNGQFVQTGEGTLAANRCYLVMNDVPEGVTKLDITKAGNAFIYQEDGKTTTANLGTASTSEPKDGKVTLTVKPIYGYYVEPADISVVPNTDAGTARAPEISDGKVEAGEIKVNADFTTTYEYTYAYTEGFQYQITVNFHKAANIQEQGKTTYEFAKVTYNGYEQKVEPTVTYDGTLLTKDVDYVLTYPDANYTNAGTKNVKINGIRKYQKELSPTFTIAKKNVNDISVETLEGQTWKAGLTESKPQVVYTGSEIKLNITDKIKDADGHDVELLSAEQVDITYKNNVNVGDASVTIKGKEVNYTGERPINYAIVAKEMTSEDIAAIPDQGYTGNEIKPVLTIKYGNITLVEGEDKDYTVAYSNNINAGEATATVNFRGNYSGEDVKKTFKIVDVDATFTVAFDSDNEWTTYYSDKNLTLADNLKAYAITGHDGKEVTTAELTFIPKETAVLLYSKSGEKTFNVETCSNETLPSDIVPDRNLFKGTLTNLNIASIAGTKFVLVDGQFVQTAEGTLAANRCYLVGSIEGVTTLTIGKGISEVITYEEGTETGAAGSARVITTPDENNNLTLVVTPKNGFYADQEHLKVVYSVNAGSARAPEVAGSEVALTPVEGYDDTSSEFRYTFPYTEGYFYQVTVNFQKCINLQAQGAQPTITLEEGTYVYDGTEKKPKIASVTIPVNGNTVTLTENKDFKVQEYQNNVNAGGTAKVIITGMNHYYNDYSKNFNIGQRDINLVKVEAIPDQTYTGQELTPALYVTDIVTINDQEVDLLNQIKDENGITIDDYTPEATDNINVGVAKVSLKATAKNYTGIKSGITFNILPKDLNAEGNNPTIDPVENQYYTGEPLEPKLTIHDGELLIPEDDYEVVYSNNIKETTDATPAIADITFKGNYKGTAQTTFQIEFKSETKALNVDFGANDEWTTYYSPIDLKDVEGLNIFVVTGLNKGQGIDLKTEQVTFIPKNIGVLLQRTNKEKTAFTGQTMSSSTTLEGVTPDTDLFRGTSTGIEDMSTIDGVKYILVDDRFIQVVEGALPANRCYVFISNEEAEDIIHVDGDDANGIIIQEEGESSTTAGQVWVELRGDGYKHITVSPSSVTYATKDEIKVVRSIKNSSQASSRNRAPGIENTVVEVIPEYPNEDPSSTTHYKFEYDSDYNYQVTVNFQKRINLSDPNVSHPVVTLKAEDIQDLVYDGKPKTPAVEKVTCNGITVDPSNYDVSYENNTNAGRPRVTITGKRFLMGSTSTEFYIGKRNFSNVTVKEPIPDQEYNDGAPIVFKGLVLEDIVDGENIVQTTDYTIVCNDTEIGSAKVSFLPANNYEGSGKGPFSFNIIPATGINQIVIDEMEGQWFDLNGQRIEGRPTQKGVYILRDKKQRSIKVRIK
ncbi:MAG: leucine-rich repeat domain-containing protein [Prevotella sp.]|nr:leucine-rich repeat domain-containing protein [Prevotella sp.]